MKNIKIGLIQAGDKFGDQYYLPYSIGLLQAYAQKHLPDPGNFDFKLPIYKKLPIVECVNQLYSNDINFFSSYVWNFQFNLEIAKGIKEKNPGSIIVFGGPQVPESQNGLKQFLQKHKSIDIGCFGEGEAPFLGILDNLLNKSWEKVHSIGYFGEDRIFYFNNSCERIKNLDDVPSPYLSNVFEPLMRLNNKEKWSALIETNRGCPFTCAFCYWGRKAKNRICYFNEKKVISEIEWFSKKKIEFVFCCDANFGLFKRDLGFAKKIVANKRRFGFPEAFSVQNTKNSNQTVFLLQKILNDSGLQKGVNLAFQSLNSKTLSSINRKNTSINDYKKLQQMFTRAKINTFSDLILGLPEETYDSFVKGITELIDNGQHSRIQFINLVILENTLLSSPEFAKKYGFIVKNSEFMPHHSSLVKRKYPAETQRLVVGNQTMPKEAWRKARVYSWAISLYYFNKLLQIPFIILNKACHISHQELIETFISTPVEQAMLSKIYRFFNKKALDIQNGGCEYIASPEWLNIWWPVDEYVFIELCKNNQLSDFYREAEELIKSSLKNKIKVIGEDLLHDSIELNKSLIKLPLIKTDLEVDLGYNIFDFYQGVLCGKTVPLIRKTSKYIVDRTSLSWKNWDDWMKEVVWYGTKKGAYLYNLKNRKTIAN